MSNNQSKILVLDIETAPIKAYVWRLFDQNVGLNQIIDNGGIICVGLKWIGDRQTYMFSDWEHGHDEMLLQTYEMMSEADAVVTYNGDAFDLKKLHGEFLMAGLPAPPPVTSIDVYKSVKKLGLVSGKLGFVGPLLAQGSKIKNEGFDLWKKVMDGDPRAQRRMEKYCIQDVRLLEKVYKKIKSYIRDHPHMGTSKHECGACGSNDVQKRGYRRTKQFKIERLACQNCGSWSSGKRTKV